MMKASPISPEAYTFRPVVQEDLLLLQGWLRMPEVVRWWGDPEEQSAFLEKDLNEPRMVMRIVSFEGRPFAYAQDYAVDVWPQPRRRSELSSVI